MGKIRDFFKRKETVETAGDIRIEAEDLLDQNYKCSEVAEETGLTEQQVYRIKKAKQRREMRMGGKSRVDDGDDENSISKLKRDILEVELRGKKAQLEHEERLRQMDREDELGGPEEFIESAQDGPDALLGTLLKTVISKQQPMISPPAQQPVMAPNAAEACSPQEDAGSPHNAPAAPPALTLDFAKLEQGIKLGLLTKETFIKESAQMNLTADKADKMYDFIRRKL